MSRRNGSAPGARCHIVLIPGFGGFDALGRIEYYAGMTRLFQQWRKRHSALPVVLHYFDNLPTAAVVTRAERLRNYLAKRIARGEILDSDSIVLVGHSTGGLDIRQLILDLHQPANNPIFVDCGLPVSAQALLERIHRVVFLSVPHWGTNIAEWVYQHKPLRRALIAELHTTAFSGSRIYFADRLEAGAAYSAAELLRADLFLALRDTLAEINASWNGPDPTRVSDAQEASSDVDLYFRQIESNFHAIEDLTPTPHPDGHSPAHFEKPDFQDELIAWDALPIQTLSYATVGGRAFEFEGLPSGDPAPTFRLTNPLEDLQILMAMGLGAKTDLPYRLCYRACAGGPLSWPEHMGTIDRTLGLHPPEPLELWDNDGIVNTVSMLWPRGETVLVQADHLDIVGHNRLRAADTLRKRRGRHIPRAYESYDALGAWPKLSDRVLEDVWSEIFYFAAMPESFSRHRKSPLSAVSVAAPTALAC